MSRNLNHDSRVGCDQDFLVEKTTDAVRMKFSSCCPGYIKRYIVGEIWITTTHSLQIHYIPNIFPSISYTVGFKFRQLPESITRSYTYKMNTTFHPVPSPSVDSSIMSTPLEQSRRPSRESAHKTHHFVKQEEKTHNTINQSIKKMWKDIKHHAIEHHRSVNATCQAQWGVVQTGPSITEARARIDHK